MSQPTTVGIIGGGQLARMTTEAAKKLGIKIVVVDPQPDCPASQVGAQQIVAKLDDKSAVNQLADMCDVITIDVEHVDAGELTALHNSGKPVRPLPSTILMIQDKLTQKQYLSQKDISVPRFVPINSRADAVAALTEFNNKMVVKARFGAYDGRGNMVVDSPDKLSEALQLFESKGIYAEEFVPFTKELAVMLARDLDGNSKIYPVIETIQNRNICEYVLAPARVDQSVADKATELAHQTAAALEGPGIFGIEMFLTKDGNIMINELAPRVHNSGHYTIEACQTSQFEQHLRAITGMELGSTDMKVPAAVMVNILGTRDGDAEPVGFDKLTLKPHTYIHTYGKATTRVDRKMGHITITSDNIDEAFEQAKSALTEISI